MVRSVGREKAAAEGFFENSAHEIASVVEAEELGEARCETAVRHVLESFLLCCVVGKERNGGF